MKGERTLRVLGAIGAAGIDALHFVEAVLTAGYGASAGKIDREYRAIGRRVARATEEQEKRQRAYNFVAYLKRDGLIEERRKGDRAFIVLTRRGAMRRGDLVKRRNEGFPNPKYSPAGGQDKITIIAFDIPERDRRKRNWLRYALRDMGLRMIQKSVWFGKQKLPQRFLDDLKMLRLTEHVEIFEISKAGTLRHLL